MTTAAQMMRMTRKQAEVIEHLASMLDGLEVEPEDDGALVFSGHGVDGPSVGYVELDGKVLWITDGG
jgi:hypothetical protein